LASPIRLQLKHAYAYFDDDSAATLLTRDEARWSATNGEVDAMAATATSH
jgi:hypothetical protein